MERVLSATVPSPPLPLPKRQRQPLLPKSSRLQFPFLPSFLFRRSPSIPLSPVLHTAPPPAQVGGELTLFAGLLGAADARFPARPASQPRQLLRLLRVAARLGSSSCSHHYRVLPSHSSAVFAAGLLSYTAGCRRMCGVSGCHGDCGLSPPPAALSRLLLCLRCPARPRRRRSEEAAISN